MSAFDPIAYIRDVRANPANYCTMSSILADVQALRAIREAKTVDALNKLFQPAARAAKAAGDTLLLGKLKDEAAARKKILEANK